MSVVPHLVDALALLAVVHCQGDAARLEGSGRVPGDGDDGLGYDFVVPARGGNLMYEVRTTPKPARELQLASHRSGKHN